MQHYWTYALGIILPSIAIFFFHRRLPVARRFKARTQSLIGAGILAAVLGLSLAQQAPVRAWPYRSYWVAALREIDNHPVCTIMATDDPNSTETRTLEFMLIQGAGVIDRGFSLSSNAALRAIPASSISFSSDGYSAAEFPAQSAFQRQLTGKMANLAYGHLSADQWDRIWRVFLQSGVVTVNTAFIGSRMNAAGFAQAAADFTQWLGQLDLINPTYEAPPGSGGVPNPSSMQNLAPGELPE
jgi:hypothetical protein